MNDFLDFMLKMVVFTLVIGVFMYFMLDAWDKEYEIDRERMEQYKMELMK